MNLHYKHISVLGVIILLLFTRCIRDDSENCVQGMDIRFYSQITCQVDVNYPEQIKDIMLFIFDKNDMLISYQLITDVKLEKDYHHNIELESGLYTAVAWSGLSTSQYNLEEIKEGLTNKHDLLFRLKRTAEHFSNIDGSKIYYGESPAVYVQTNKSESVFEDVSINMLEITNRITITVEGLTRLDDYQIEIESNSASMNIDGTIAPDETIEYVAEHGIKDEIINATFTLLKLETGYDNTIVIKNKLDGTEMYRGSLLGTLLLKNPNVNLNCDHDFTIKFTTKDQCDCGTYTITEIWVNNWLVHSYNTEM